MSSPLDATITVFPTLHDTSPQRHVKAREAIEEVRSGRFQKGIEPIRQLESKEARSRAKKRLPAYTFSGRFTRRAIAGLVEPSGLLCLDYDGLDDLEAARAKVAACPHVAAAFMGPSGMQRPGLKVIGAVSPVPRTNAEHHLAYDALASALGLSTEADRAAKDVSRLCYTSFDPEAYINEDAAPLAVDYSGATSGEGRGPGEQVDRLEEGHKYETLRHFGGLLRYGGASGEMIETALQAIRLHHSDAPGEAEPIEKLAAWLGDLDPDERGSLTGFLREVHTPDADPPDAPAKVPPFVPFSTSLLPRGVADYVTAHAAALNVDEAAIAVPVLAALAAAVGNSYEASPKPGWRERAAVWACLIQPSGTLKSQAVYVAVAPVLALEREAAERYRQDHEDFEANLSQWNELTKALKRETPKPSKPERVRYRTGDTTIESLGAVHADAPRGVLGYRDELSGWLGSFDRYARGDADMANWMEMCGGRPIVIDRKSSERGVLYIERPNVSMVGTIQPSTLTAKLTPGHFASGFTARLLLTEPPTRARRWTEATASASVDAAYHELVRTLYRAAPDSGVLPFTPGGTRTFATFYDENGAVMGRLPDGPLRASLSKIEAYVVRLSLIFYLCECARTRAEPTAIPEDAVERAVVIGRWLRYEQARVYRLHAFDRLAMDADARKALDLPPEFAWQDVADVWGVKKSGAFVVIRRLIEKQVAEDTGHGRYRRRDNGRLDFVDYGISFGPLVHKVHRSTDHFTTAASGGDGVASGEPAPPVSSNNLEAPF